ncbi:uracil-DNA glycosylase family protein [Variovorax sp. J2P1-59]|uniref:uracil-DNA glycosylase family protein n=1 Tax=Variovorax flavidus TaxID=3053501 RepID=UPI00257726AC|nr:uracil-DNA glycosylase family protein [Variovorax sp. J2P1-59]MDM0075026.1 uracil-DNA glycosylase family protein [Variovorax sp. J2P1-59]
MTTGGVTLDARQRAMLDEMGIKLFWWPKGEQVEAPAVAAAVAPAAGDAVVDEASVEQRAPAAPVRARAVEPAAAPAMAPRAPVPATHGASILVDAPRLLYGDAAAPQGGWLIVADMPPELDGRHGEPFAGDAGRLFDNMLRALQLHDGETPVHLMRTHRGVASGQPESPRPIADVFAEHAAALAPRLVLAMGPLAAQSLLQSGDPLGKLRGRALPVAILPGVQDAPPVVATYHPAYLLRNPADKGRAWADLCLAAEQLARAG